MAIFAIVQIEPLWLCISTCQGDLLFTSIIIHWIAPGDRSAPTDRSAASRLSTRRTSRDINMRSLSISRGTRLSQPAPTLLERHCSENTSYAASDATDYGCQKVSSVPVAHNQPASSGDASMLLGARAAPTDGIDQEASYSYTSTFVEERTIAESSSSTDSRHLRCPRPALLGWPGEAARVSYSALSGLYSVERGTG
jgi:hypothetical protein